MIYDVTAASNVTYRFLQWLFTARYILLDFNIIITLKKTISFVNTIDYFEKARYPFWVKGQSLAGTSLSWYSKRLVRF